MGCNRCGEITNALSAYLFMCQVCVIFMHKSPTCNAVHMYASGETYAYRTTQGDKWYKGRCTIVHNGMNMLYLSQRLVLREHTKIGVLHTSLWSICISQRTNKCTISEESTQRWKKAFIWFSKEAPKVSALDSQRPPLRGRLGNQKSKPSLHLCSLE